MIVFALACSEYTVHDAPAPDPVDPPGYVIDAQGEPPDDWDHCNSGWFGQYFNLTVDHPDVEPADDAPLPGDPDQLDWWDPSRISFETWDPTLDLGENWWPVDDGLEKDPQYFTVSWTAWLRVESNTDLQIVFGAADDAWLDIGDVSTDGQRVALPGVHPFEPEVYDIGLQPGQIPLHLRFAQRKDHVDGLRFRVASGDVLLCYPTFPDEGLD